MLTYEEYMALSEEQKNVVAVNAAQQAVVGQVLFKGPIEWDRSQGFGEAKPEWTKD